MEPDKRLKLFVQKIEELRSCKLLQSQEGFGYKFSLKYDQSKGLSTQLREPEEEDLRSFLLTFRQFVSQNEPVYAHLIYNLCYRELEEDDLRNHAVESRREWDKAVKNSGLGLNFNGADFTPERIADLWINGHYFHSDENKRAILESMAAPGIPIARAYFLDFLVNATRQIVFLGHLVAFGLEHSMFRFQGD